ncbi:ABC transporter permease [Roseburia hominis]
MLNMLRMDLYRMFRTKSLYVIWIVMAVMVIVTTYLSKTDYDIVTVENKQEGQAEQSGQSGQETEPVNLGMSVEIPVEPGEKLTLFDIFYANAQAKFIALFLAIFAVMFSTADISSGYIKNIGGQVRNRGLLIMSKAVALVVFTILSMLLFVGALAVGMRIFFRELLWGNVGDFLIYFGIQLLLHIAFVILCMTIAVVLRNNVVSMVIVVCLSMNIMVVLYSAIDKCLQQLGSKEFQTIQYTLTGKISLLSMAPGGKECAGALCVATVFGIGLLALCSLIFKKRDI